MKIKREVLEKSIKVKYHSEDGGSCEAFCPHCDFSDLRVIHHSNMGGAKDLAVGYVINHLIKEHGVEIEEVA